MLLPDCSPPLHTHTHTTPPTPTPTSPPTLALQSLVVFKRLLLLTFAMEREHSGDTHELSPGTVFTEHFVFTAVSRSGRGEKKRLEDMTPFISFLLIYEGTQGKNLSHLI